jgi:hypothetical protein
MVSGCIGPHFLDLGSSWGEWSASHPGRYNPEERGPVAISYEVGWTPEPVWTTCRRENLDLNALELRPLGRPARSTELMYNLLNVGLLPLFMEEFKNRHTVMTPLLSVEISCANSTLANRCKVTSGHRWAAPPFISVHFLKLREKRPQNM